MSWASTVSDSAQLGLPDSPVVPERGGAQAAGQARQVFLFPAPGRLDPAPGSLQLGGRRAGFAQAKQLGRDPLFDRGDVGARSGLELDEKLAGPVRRRVGGLDPGGDLVGLDQ